MPTYPHTVAQVAEATNQPPGLVADIVAAGISNDPTKYDQATNTVSDAGWRRLVSDLCDFAVEVPFTHPDVGTLPGYLAGLCGHRVARSEWRAGFRTCERCELPEPPVEPELPASEQQAAMLARVFLRTVGSHVPDTEVRWRLRVARVGARVLEFIDGDVAATVTEARPARGTDRTGVWSIQFPGGTPVTIGPRWDTVVEALAASVAMYEAGNRNLAAFLAGRHDRA